MGDRGGTATPYCLPPPVLHYTRWEIGGEPQQQMNAIANVTDYTRWEIGGEPQHYRTPCANRQIIPDGRSGGEPQQPARVFAWCSNYTRWEIGGEPQHDVLYD